MFVKAPDFNLEATLDSGQVFGFVKTPGNIYHGHIRGVPVRLSQKNGSLSIVGVIHESPLREYFDLDRDLSPVYQILQNDAGPQFLKLKGLRLVHQDSWEALACFILSSNSNVKRIQGIWRNLSQYFGGHFPAPAQIAKSHERILRGLGLGYRAPFLYHTAQFVANNPACLQVIREASYEEAKERVLAFPGIGEKVADCVLLYGFQKHEAFPVDVWIRRVMRRLYFRGRSVSDKKILIFGQKRWGPWAGYVQQYLFHAARSGIRYN